MLYVLLSTSLTLQVLRRDNRGRDLLHLLEHLQGEMLARLQ